MGLIRLLKHDLAMESRTWVEKQIITPDQAAEICKTYGIDFHNMDRRSRGYWVLVLLGYLFIGLALITLVSANWEQIPRAVRMGGLISITLATHLAGLMTFVRGKEGPAVGLFFLGSLFYGASVMLIAQIYHLGEHYPDGTLIWALGVLPLALLLKSRALMLLTVTLAGIWFTLEIHLGYFPWLFPVFLGAAAWHLFRAGSSRTLFLSLVILTGLFLEYCISWWIGAREYPDLEIENLFFAGGWVLVCYGLSKYLISRDNPGAKDYGTLLSLWCLRFFIFTLFVLSFEAFWEKLLPEVWQAPELALAVGIIMSFAGAALAFMGDRQLKTLVVPGLAGLVFMAYLLGALGVEDRYAAIYFTVADNIILVVAGIWLIVNGIRNHVSHYFFLGVVTVLLTGLVRYVDLVGDYIGAAALFLGFAVILLATAKFWKSRKGEKI
ncbi:MAG: DUF2157 domain-containing protein [Desulfobacterales bacterium]|nr:DUF2157 domain-containing protein [Desulfobacterales bacterium]